MISNKKSKINDIDKIKKKKIAKSVDTESNVDSSTNLSKSNNDDFVLYCQKEKRRQFYYYYY